jgi:hypothetical protein
LGEKTWEKAERKMLQQAVSLALSKRDLQVDDAEVILAGDLLNQTVSANYAARELARPFLGLYGACSTMAEALLLGAILTYEHIIVKPGNLSRVNFASFKINHYVGLIIFAAAMMDILV